jgi:hypothetical protein
MSDERINSADVIARARRAWSPGAADAERVGRALGVALADGPKTGGNRPDAGPYTPAWASRVLLAGALAAASGGAGYWAGHRAGLRETRSHVPVVSAARPVEAIAETRPPAARPPGAVAQALATPSLVPPLHDSHGAHHGAQNPRPSQTESLATEVLALRNAERALRDDNPGLALAFLQELDRQVPHGQLTEERDAAATLARCARGDHPFGVSLAAEFTERHPGSVYRARVEQACPATDSPAPGDSPPRRSE